MNIRSYRIALSISLLLAVLLPMGVDAAHFLIFHHHDSIEKTGQATFYPSESHSICQYEFTTQILDNQIINIKNLQDYQDISLILNPESPKHSTLFSFSLRAPPFENQF